MPNLAPLALILTASPQADALDEQALRSRLRFEVEELSFSLHLDTTEIEPSADPTNDIIARLAEAGGSGHPAALLREALDAWAAEEVEVFQERIQRSLQGFQTLLQTEGEDLDLVYLFGFAATRFMLGGGPLDTYPVVEQALGMVLGREPERWYAACVQADVLTKIGLYHASQGDRAGARKRYVEAEALLVAAAAASPGRFVVATQLATTRANRLHLDEVDYDDDDYWEALVDIASAAGESAESFIEPVPARCVAHLLLFFPLLSKFSKERYTPEIPPAVDEVLPDMIDDFEQLGSFEVYAARAATARWLLCLLSEEDDEPEAFARAVALSDDPLLLYILRMKLAARIADCAKAEETAREFMLQAEGVTPRLITARTYLACGLWNQAIDVLNQGLRKTPDHPRLLTALGVAYLRANAEPKRAAGILDHALAQDPTDGYAHFARGTAHALEGALEKALQHLEPARDLLADGDDADKVEATLAEVREARSGESD